MQHSDPSPSGSPFALRFACWGGLVVLIISYAVLIPMKARGMLPVEMTYTGIIAGPALMIWLIVGPLLAERWFPQSVDKWLLAICIVTVIIGLTIVWITKG